MSCSSRWGRGGPIAVSVAALSFWLVCSPTWAQPPRMGPQQIEPGLSINDAQAFQGYSLVAPMNSTTTYLIDMKGHVVNRWESDFRPGASAYLLENGHLLRTGAQSGGSIGGAASGGRIQEFSWDGELVWDYSLSTDRLQPHHDICPMPGGNVLVIAWDKKTTEEAVAAGRIPETVQGHFLPDCILEVQPTGKTSGEIVWEWHAWDHLIQEVDESKPNYGEVAEHPELIDINFGTNVMASMVNDPEQLAKLRALGYVGGGRDSDRRPDGPGSGGRRGGGPMGPDWMHTNSVDYNAELDQIMLSIHEFSEVWIIDHSTTIEEAASHSGGRSGKGGDLLYRWGNPRAYRSGINVDQRLFAQHCAHWIPKGLPGEGHMLVFNNGNSRPDGVYSSVDEVVLPVDAEGNYKREEYLAFGPEQALWSYSEPEQGTFFSMNISGAQRLPNGNTFVCSGAQGLLFEVTLEKEVVWKYSMPQLGFGGPGGPGDIRPGVLLPSFLQDMLGMTEEQERKLARMQKDVDDELAEILTREQRLKLQAPMRLAFGGQQPGRDGDDRRGAGRRGGRGGPDGFGRPSGFTPPRPGEVLPAMLAEPLELSRQQTLTLNKLQKQVDDRLAKMLTKAQKSQLDAMQRAFAGGPGAGPPSFGRPGGMPPGFPPPGFGPPGFGPPGGDSGGPNRGSRPDERDAAGGPPAGGRGGPGGLFTCYRYGLEHPGFAGKEITPGDDLTDLIGSSDEPRRPEGAR